MIFFNMFKVNEVLIVIILPRNTGDISVLLKKCSLLARLGDVP